MNTTTLNRWLQPLVWLLVIDLIVMLLIPTELTDEQLAQIKPGMTMAEVHRRIGKSNVREGWPLISFEPPRFSERERSFLWHRPESWLQPTVNANIPKDAIKSESENQSSLWVGKSSLLWV